ncbi:MAG: C25 family cysteine peptidase [Bacteroidales bacterium]
MKNNSIVLLILLLFLFLWPSFSVSAQAIEIKGPSQTKTELHSISFTQLQIKNTIASVNKIYTISLANRNFLQLQISGYMQSKQIGAPSLPIKTEIIEIPYGSDIHIKIKEKEYQKISLKELGYTQDIVPVQASVSKSATAAPVFKCQEKIYKKNKYSDTPLVRVEYLGEMRGTSYARITIAPVQYNPVQKSLRIYHTLNFSIEFKNADEAYTMKRKQIYASSEFKGLESQKINDLSSESVYTQNKKDLSKGDANYVYPANHIPRYVIVSDTLFAQGLQPFIAWKKQQGFDVLTAYTSNAQVGKTTQSIKAYLKKLYDHPTAYQAAPSYILLVGDIEQIPSFSSTLSKSEDNIYTVDHVTDLYYAEYTGDYLPDAHYGRFSASTVEQLLPQIEKTLQMEQLNIPSTQFMDTTVLIAGYDKSWGFRLLNKQLDYARGNYFNADQGIYTHAYRYPESSSQSKEIISDINKGACVVGYTAHGDWDRWANPLITISDIKTQFQNSNKYPLMIGNCCLSCKFDKPECFGEALLRANKKGAVVYIGASNSTCFIEDFCWAVGAVNGTMQPDTVNMENITYQNTGLGVYDKLFHTHGEDVSQWIQTASEMVIQGNLSVMASASNSENYYWEIYHVLGDPSYRIPVRNPDSLKVDHPKEILPGEKQISIQTEAYAGVCIHQGDLLLAYGVADSTGAITLPLELQSIQAITLRVWAPFKRDYIQKIPISSPENAYVFIINKEVKNKGKIDQNRIVYNDLYTVDVELQNIGQSVAKDLKVELTSLDSNIAIVVGQSNALASLNIGDSVLLKDQLKFKVHPNVKDSIALSLKLRVSSQGQIPLEQNLAFLASASVLEVVKIQIEDATTNKPNGKLDANETVKAHLLFRNIGSAPLRNAKLKISSPQTYIHPSQEDFFIGDLAVGQTKNIDFILSATDQAPKYSLYILDFTAHSLERREVFSCKESISLVMEDFENGSFSRMEWDTLASTWSVVKDIASFAGDYCAKSASIKRNDSSHLIIHSNSLVNDSISFYYKVSSERRDTYGDFFQFYINDELMCAYAGLIPWNRAVFPVKKGYNTFRWTYVKDDSDDKYKDCAWVDNITFPLGTPRALTKEKDKCWLNQGVETNKFRAFVNESGEIELLFNLSRSWKGSIYLMDIKGNKVAVLSSNICVPLGNTSLRFASPKLSKSLYFCVFETEDERLIQKIMIVK